VLFAGDSITYGAGWRPTPEDYLNTGWSKIIRDNNNLVIGSYGLGGTTIVKRTGRTDSIVERISKMFSEYPNADYIILQGGVNDAWSSVPLGTVTTGYDGPFDETTYCGAFESMLRQCILNWKGKKIGFIITHKIKTAEGVYNFAGFMQKSRDICEKWSVPYIDLYKYSGITGDLTAINNMYFQLNNGVGDYTHPTQLGYQILTPKIESWMKTL
jgi:lysophospholipase L1-like esterase